ncbi:MAG: response regulator [Lachnospiraceae bacterium]|nr:response regulator [Lachnospiraceae bacterium]
MFINDYCAEKNAQVVVVGTKDEYGALCSYIPTGSVLAFYTRPLNMDVLVDRVSGYFDEESGEERKKSILIVDDDVSYMSMIMDWLKDKYRISIANSGMQAIMMLGKSKVDLILLDYEMPVTSGPQVLEMIRSNPSTADIPVMFLTGKGDKESIMKVLAFKPEGYMLKTIQREELKGNLEKFFKGRKA